MQISSLSRRGVLALSAAVALALAGCGDKSAPAAGAAAKAVATVAKNTPIVATAITDFVAAKLVKSDDAPGGNVTGVSDLGPIEAQLDLLLKFIPNAKVVGTIYNSSEINSAY